MKLMSCNYYCWSCFVRNHIAQADSVEDMFIEEDKTAAAAVVVTVKPFIRLFGSGGRAWACWKVEIIREKRTNDQMSKNVKRNGGRE